MTTIKPELLEKLLLEYNQLHDDAKNIANNLTRLFEVLLQHARLSPAFPIQQRVKDWNSIAQKLERLTVRVKHVYDLQDLIGLRIVLLTQKDVDDVCKLIEENCSVLRKYNTLSRLKEDQFGYVSIHYIISSKTVTSPGSFNEGINFQAEIQVRTLAQHIWAEISHRLQYKREEGLPHSVSRSIAILSEL